MNTVQELRTGDTFTLGSDKAVTAQRVTLGCQYGYRHIELTNGKRWCAHVETPLVFAEPQ